MRKPRWWLVAALLFAALGCGGDTANKGVNKGLDIPKPPKAELPPPAEPGRK